MDDLKQDKSTRLHLDIKPVLKNWFTENLLWKALSIAFAVFLWVMAMGQNPILRHDVTRPVELRGLGILAQHNLMLLNENTLRAIIVAEVARRRDTTILSDDVVLFIDFSQLDNLAHIDAQTFVSLPVQTELDSLTVDSGYILTPRTLYLNAQVDRIGEFELPLELVVTEPPAGNYSYGNMIAYHDTITFTAPASIGEVITRAVVNLNLEEATGHFIAGFHVQLLSEEGEIVTSPHITRQFDSVYVDIPIASLAHVPLLEPTIIGSEDLAPFTVFEGFTMDMHSAAVFGDAELVGTVQHLSLPDIDITGQGSSFVHSVDLNSLLPEDLTLRGSHTVNITVHIETIEPEPEQVVAFELPMSQLTLTGYFPQGYHLLLDPVNVQLLGDSVDVSLITGQLYLPDALTPGLHVLPVELNLPEQLLASPVFASLYMSTENELAHINTPYVDVAHLVTPPIPDPTDMEGDSNDD